MPIRRRPVRPPGGALLAILAYYAKHNGENDDDRK